MNLTEYFPALNVFLLLFFLIFFYFRKKFSTFFRIMAFYSSGNIIRISLWRLGGVKVGNNCSIGKYVRIAKNVQIRNNVIIKSNAIIGENSLINDNVRLGFGSNINNFEIGAKSFIDIYAILSGSENKSVIGKNTYIGQNCLIDGSGGIKIGDYVHITSGTMVWTHSSIKQALLGKNLNDKSNVIFSKVIIENKSWIGGNTTIYPGIKIGSYTAILSNSVVNRDIPSNKMFGGSPVVFVRNIVLSDNEVLFDKK